MSSNRPKLSLRLNGPETEKNTSERDLILWSIEHHLCVRATYNRGILILGPHILYERGGALYVEGVVVERDGMPGRRDELVRFKLSALRNLVETIEPLPMLADYSPPEGEHQVLAAIAA